MSERARKPKDIWSASRKKQVEQNGERERVEKAQEIHRRLVALNQKLKLQEIIRDL